MRALKKFDWETMTLSKDEVLVRLEPLLKSQFSLYGGMIKLNLDDMQEVMKAEIYKHHKVQINQQKERIEELQSENDGLRFVAHEYSADNDRLRAEVDDLKKKISEMEWHMQTEIKRIRLNAEEQIRKNNEDCERRLFHVRSYLTAEIEVNR